MSTIAGWRKRNELALNVLCYALGVAFFAGLMLAAGGTLVDVAFLFGLFFMGPLLILVIAEWLGKRRPTLSSTRWRRRVGWNWPTRGFAYVAGTVNPDACQVLRPNPYYRPSFYTPKPGNWAAPRRVRSIYARPVEWEVWERFRKGKQRRRGG
jgi:hypothetical protein